MMQLKNTKGLLFAALLGLTVLANAQYTISGSVTEKAGESLLGVNVYIQGTYDGATTDLDGNFSFVTFKEDSLVLIASFVGFHNAVIPLEPKSQSVTIELREEISQLNAVVITAGSFDASDENKRVVLKPLDIVTTAGATADIPGALNTLPGTQAVGETGRLFVRGGDGRETKTFIDGMLVHNEYSPSAPNTPGRSRFSPMMFKGMSFSTGGYSAEYGQALSSALILKSKDVAENDRTDLSLMTVGTDIATTKSLENGSIAAKAQYTNLTPYFALAPQNLDWNKAPEEWNGNVAYRHKTSKTGMLKVYANASTSNMDLFESDIANQEVKHPVKVTNDYTHLNLSYREVLGDKWGIRGGVSYTTSDDFASLAENSMDQNLDGYHVKAVADYVHSDRFTLLFGAERTHRSLEQELVNATESFEQNFNEGISATFVESETFISSSLAFKTGVRVEHNSLNDQVTWAPRLATAYKTGEFSQLAMAYGQFYQAPSNQLILTQPQVEPEKSTHYIMNYQWIKEGRSFRIEAYEKNYSDLVTYQNSFDPASISNQGDGFARGLDLFWRDSKTFNNMDYWVSYSYLDTEREYLDFPGSFAPAFASKHNFSFVMKKFIEPLKSQLGVTYSFASSRSFHDPNSDQFMSGKTPAYHDLSMNVSYLLSNQVIIHGMVNNVLGINNVFGYEFSDQPDANGVYASKAITPPAKRFVFIGVFITLSKNKGINQLPNL